MQKCWGCARILLGSELQSMRAVAAKQGIERNGKKHKKKENAFRASLPAADSSWISEKLLDDICSLQDQRRKARRTTAAINGLFACTRLPSTLALEAGRICPLEGRPVHTSRALL